MNEEFAIDTALVTPPDKLSQAVTNYSQHFVMELALGLESPDSLCIRYDITPYEYACLLANPVFQSDLNSWKQRMVDEGLSFKLKARVQAEAYLEEIDNLVNDPDTSKETKLAAISRVVAWGGLEQSKNSTEGSSKPSITINIAPYAAHSSKNVIEIE